MRRLRGILSAVAVAAMIAVASPARADVSATDVKAAFLPRFARYVTWPPSASPSGAEPFVLCVIGDDPFGNNLDTAARSQSVDGRRIVVRRLSSADGAGACQIAYVSGNRSQAIAQSLASLRGKPVLTVTDSRNGGERGIIHFTIVNGRVRFYINDADADRLGLQISSRLLALAISVKQ